jgi:uncharacterized protein (DUF362 family)
VTSFCPSVIIKTEADIVFTVGGGMELSRREFIKNLLRLGSGAAVVGALAALAACAKENEPASSSPPPTSNPEPTPKPVPSTSPSTSNPAPTQPPTAIPSPVDKAYLAVARGQNPGQMVTAAVKALGGMERFVKKGNDVIIKPNICVDYYTYEYAVTTNPEVVGTLVKLCLAAGAGRVRVMDQPFGGTAQQAYERTGIAKAVKDAGGEMEIMSGMKFREIAIPDGRDIKKWSVYADALNTDVLINVPIAKHHNLGRLTLGMKNLMGLIKDRSQFHFNLGQRVADLTSLLRPELTVVDAVRILTNHGPTGGSLADVKLLNTVIASHDIVAADAYAATLFGLTGDDIPAVRAAVQMGLGTSDLKNVKVEEISV